MLLVLCIVRREPFSGVGHLGGFDYAAPALIRAAATACQCRSHAGKLAGVWHLVTSREYQYQFCRVVTLLVCIKMLIHVNLAWEGDYKI